MKTNLLSFSYFNQSDNYCFKVLMELIIDVANVQNVLYNF